MTSNIIQALWIGDRLSVMERLSIRSFLHQGHEFHLYLYRRSDGAPEGTTIREGGEILDGGVVTAAILRRVPQRISTGAWFWSRRLRQRFRRS